MAQSRPHNVTPVNDGGDSAAACALALAETSKALKAFSFYPERHPLRDRILNAAYEAVADALREDAICVVVQRHGFSLAQQQGVIANNPMTAALAHELFSREIQRLTLLPELSLSDFIGFISILTVEAQKVSAAGGLGVMLENEGIATVLVNEIDISAVFTKRKVGSTEEVSDDKGASAAQDDEPQRADSAAPSGSDAEEEASIAELLTLMAAEREDDRYRQLARRLLAKGQPLRLHGDVDRLYAILAGMAGQRADATRSPVQHDCALMVLQQLALGEPAEHLLDHLEDEQFCHKEKVAEILAQLGGEVVEAVAARLVTAGARPVRSWLSTVFSRIGRPALPALLGLLKDERWQVVQSAAVVLGEMGLREAVKGLSLAALHYDDRVRVESIRSLARIGGMEATSVLLGLVQSGDEIAAIHAITWLGNTRNHSALQPLLELVMKRDPFGKGHNLKKPALVAIGRIGDREALEPLFKLVKRRHLIASSRYAQLKSVAVETIGNIGGNSALAFLESLAAKGGYLGQKAAATLAAMAQRKNTRNA